MIIKSNKAIAYEKFMFLNYGQLFSIDDLYSNKDKTVKRYFIKVNPITVPHRTESAFTGCGYAVDLENGDFIIVKLDKIVILETGHAILEG